MSDDEQRQERATGDDRERQAPTSGDSRYSLSIEDALHRYEAAGIPRTTRSVQRYCAKGALDCHRIETPFGVKFLIDPASVDRHIAYIQEVRPVATSRDVPRPVATDVAGKNNEPELRHEAATSGDGERQAATAAPVSPLVAADQRVIELLENENKFLRDQVSVKDGQIKELTERSRETNLLVHGLQRMLGPLLSPPNKDQRRAADDDF